MKDSTKTKKHTDVRLISRLRSGLSECEHTSFHTSNESKPITISVLPKLIGKTFDRMYLLVIAAILPTYIYLAYEKDREISLKSCPMYYDSVVYIFLDSDDVIKEVLMRSHMPKMFAVTDEEFERIEEKIRDVLS